MVKIRKEQISSGTATDGHVLTADGAGNADWEAPAGGTVDAGDVTYTPTTLTDWDSDADPGDVDAALDQLAERIDDVEGAAGHDAVTLGAGNDADMATLTTQELTVVLKDHDHSAAGDGNTFDAANLTSGASTDGQVLTSDGAGGTAWEDPPAGGIVDAGDVTYAPTTATDWDSDADPGNVDDALDQLAERVDDLEAGGGDAGITITWAVSTTTAGVDQNRNTSGSFTSQTGRLYIQRPLKITSFLIDIRNADNYKLSLTSGPSGTDVQVICASVAVGGAGEITFTPDTAPLILLPGCYYLTLTALGGATTWSDLNAASASNALFYADYIWYGTTGYGTYTVPVKIVAYVGTIS